MDATRKADNDVRLPRSFAIFSAALSMLFCHSAIAGHASNPHDDIDYDYNFSDKMQADYALSPHSASLMGDQLDIASGALEFEHVDVSVPGNSSLPVEIRRRYSATENNGISYDFRPRANEFGDWSLSVPKIVYKLADPKEHLSNASDLNYSVSLPQGYLASVQEHCSGVIKPSAYYEDHFQFGSLGARTLGGSVYVAPEATASAPQLIVPGTASDSLLSNPGWMPGVAVSEYRWVTKSRWRIKCIAQADGSGEGFLAESPDGVKYTFDTMFVKSAPATHNYLTFSQYEFVATKVEDRFGNWVRYNYNTTTEQLTSITSNDGRVINITYVGDFIDRVTVNGRQWTYGYDSPTECPGCDAGQVLRTVTLPDGREWYFELADRIDGSSGNVYVYDCRVPSAQDQGTLSVTHPDGTLGTFVLGWKTHAKTNVPAEGGWRWSVPKKQVTNTRCSILPSLVTKSLSGPGLPTAASEDYVWEYEYSQNAGQYKAGGPVLAEDGIAATYSLLQSDMQLTGPLPANVDNLHYKWTKVTLPDSSYVKHFVDRDTDSASSDKIVATVHYSATGAVLRQTRSSYASGTIFGGNLYPNHSNLLVNQSPKLTKAETEESGDVYTTDYLNFDLYDFPQDYSEYNSYSSNTRYGQTTFYHDIDNWLLGLPRVRKVGTSTSDLIAFRETTYHPSTGSYKSLPNEIRVMGVWQGRFDEYHSDGNVKKIVYNGTNRYELFENYKRGQAQKITLPCATTNGCTTANGSTSDTVVTSLTMDNNGWLQDTTDFKGNVVSYDYDPVGRLKLIDPQDPFVANTTVSYSTVTSAGDGITGSGVVAGMFRQTVSRGDYEKRLYHDTLLRPVFTREMDVSESATARYSRASFDYRNQPTFTSLASESVAATAGTDTVYDALGRIKTTTRNTDNSTTSIVYLADNKVQVTDPKSNITTTQYLAYGAPDQSNPVEIVAPENVTTVIGYNALGQTTSVSQGGITENRYYDSLQQLCKVHRPETGNTAYAYTARRELHWFAEGTGGSTTSCDSGSVEASKKVMISYNNQGEKDGIDYPDSAPDVSFGFDENGNLDNLTAGNVSHVYNYNNQDLLTRETLNIVESGYTKTLELAYGYNSLEYQILQEYPNGNLVEFDVNALGQALNAQSYIGGVVDKTYATNAVYYADGMLNGFTFGNGVTHSTTRDVNLLPERITDQLGSSNKMMDLEYGYDQNLNITSLIDHRDGNFSLSNLSYDGLDRLKTTTGGSGIGSSSLTYDVLGNIQTYNSKNSSLVYTYDTSKNRLSSVSGTGSDAKSYAYFNYDDRGNVNHNSHRSLTFNRANQLTDSDGNTYLYDGHNRRVKQVDGSGTSYSMYSQGGRLLYRETGVDGSTGIGDTANYVFLGKKLIAKEGVFANTGSSLQHYKPYGQTIETPKDEVGYSGHKYDADLELSYMQARYYDPAIGRFYSNDPVGFKAINPMSFNRYMYANNNSYKFIDPNGEEIVPVGTREEVEAIEKAIGEIERSNEDSAARIQELRESDNKHTVRFPREGERPENKATGKRSNESNGVGTGSETITDPNASVRTRNKDGSIVANSGNTVLTHELLGHGVDKDRGTMDRSINPDTGERRSEESAMEAEAKYKNSVGETLRDRHSARE